MTTPKNEIRVPVGTTVMTLLSEIAQHDYLRHVSPGQLRINTTDVAFGSRHLRVWHDPPLEREQPEHLKDLPHPTPEGELHDTPEDQEVLHEIRVVPMDSGGWWGWECTCGRTQTARAGYPRRVQAELYARNHLREVHGYETGRA